MFLRTAHGGPIVVMAQSEHSMKTLVTLILMHFLWLRANDVSKDKAIETTNKATKKIMDQVGITNKTPQTPYEARRLVEEMVKGFVSQGIDFPRDIKDNMRLPDHITSLFAKAQEVLEEKKKETARILNQVLVRAEANREVVQEAIGVQPVEEVVPEEEAEEEIVPEEEAEAEEAEAEEAEEEIESEEEAEAEEAEGEIVEELAREIESEIERVPEPQAQSQPVIARARTPPATTDITPLAPRARLPPATYYEAPIRDDFIEEFQGSTSAEPARTSKKRTIPERMADFIDECSDYMESYFGVSPDNICIICKDRPVTKVLKCGSNVPHLYCCECLMKGMAGVGGPEHYVCCQCKGKATKRARN